MTGALTEHPAAAEYRAKIALIQPCQIMDQESLDGATVVLKQANAALKNLEAELKSFTEPHREAESKVRSWFRPGIEAGKDLVALLKSKIGAYYLEQQRRQALALAAAADQFKTGDVSAGTTALAAVPEAPAASKGVGVRTVEKFRIVNPDAVPREACSPDESKIKALRALGREVPGVEFYQDTQVAVRLK
jgi:hypothetical protein